MAGETTTINPMAQAILASAGRLGIDPVDLGTAISYETAGTFDPWKAGPTTQWGQHRGLIQWGEPQRKQYGVTQDMSLDDQMRAVERYLIDRGVKPGMGLLDVYSAINAGGVGLYNRSDANNGGAPGTVADKVRDQMSDHRAKAARMLGSAAPVVATAAPATAPVVAPTTPATATPAPVAPALYAGRTAATPETSLRREIDDKAETEATAQSEAQLMEQLQAAAKLLAPQQTPMAQIQYPDMRRAKAVAHALMQAGALS